MIIKFSKDELKAVTHLAMLMIAVDGKIEEVEKFILFSQVLNEVGNVDDVESIIEESEKFDLLKAIEIVKKFSYTDKYYVAAYLGFLIASDGNIDNREMELWQLITKACDLPTMSVDDAINFLQTNN